MNNENKNTNNIKEETINALNNSGDNMDTNKDTTNNTNNSDIKPIRDGNRVYNIQNLQPVRSKEEARKRGRNGGIKSGEVRKARKTMRETILAMLEKEISPEKLAEYGIDSKDMTDNTYQSALIASMLREALNGSEKAMTLVRDTIGEAPALHTINQTEIITKEDLQTIDNLKQYLTG